jgi:hypothetical protein
MTRYPEIQQEDDSQIKYQMKNFAVFSAHLKKKKKKKKKKENKKKKELNNKVFLLARAQNQEAGMM